MIKIAKSRAAAVLVAAVAGLGAAVVTPVAAQAALSKCTGTKSVSARNGNVVSVPSRGSSTSCLLRLGDRNTGSGPIFTLQHALVVCASSNISIDGVYGQQTKGVVAVLQALNDIEDDGIYGPATRKVLYWPSVGWSEGDRTCHRTTA